MNSKVLLGLCPIGKFVFSHDDAIRQKKMIQIKLDELGVRYVDLDLLLHDSDGLLREQNQVDQVVRFFKDQQVDALFLPHCNFGTEGAAGMITAQMQLPTLLWGPRDDCPEQDGTRKRDSLCGLLASSKVMRKMVGNRFTYIENSHLDDAVFLDGLQTFLSAAAVVKAAKNMRIGLLGARIDFFWSCIVNESELLERFGIEVKPFEIAPFLQAVERLVKTDKKRLSEKLASLKQDWLNCDHIDETELLKGVAAADVIMDMKKEYRLDAMAIQNFFSIADALGSGAALYTMIAEEQFPLADESDIHGAISLVLLQAANATGNIVFCPEYVIRHPADDHCVCLWHVGAPASLRDKQKGHVTIESPWILPGEKPIQAQMKLMNGPITLCRFDGDTGAYRLGIGEGEIVDGPKTRDYYGWLKVKNWPKWERQLIEGPYIHHCAAIYGNCGQALIEAGKYLNLPVEIFGDSLYSQQTI